MTLESALKAWLDDKFAVPAYWLERPQGAKRCIVYRCLSPNVINEQNGLATGIKDDIYSITVYMDTPDEGKTIADAITAALNGLHHTTLGGIRIQRIIYNSGYDQPLYSDGGVTVYQFNRDFRINY